MPDPGYPDYASGIALAGAHRMPLPLDPLAGFRPVFDGLRPRSAALVFLNYPSNPCGVAAPAGVFAEAVAFAGAHRGGARPRLRLRRPRLRRPQAREHPRDTRRARRRRRALHDVEELRHGRAGGSASSSATRRSSRASRSCRITCAPGSSCRCSTRGSRRSATGRRTSSRAAISTRRAATASSARSPGRALDALRCEGSYLRLDPSSRGRHRDVAPSRAPGRARTRRGLRNGRPRLGAALPLRCGRPPRHRRRTPPGGVCLRTTAGRRQRPAVLALGRS